MPIRECQLINSDFLGEVIVSDQETYFGLDEMFISATDAQGLITSCNDVFIRVSGYSKERLIGAPHNIIRHPDMPKAVFKLLWDTIQSGKPICAYVKNRSIDGKHYWVVASVVPSDDSYLSVRFKPSSEIFGLIPGIYSQMLEIEKQKGVEASTAFLIENLKKLGFNSYEEFQSKLLEEEINSRDKKLAEMGKSEKLVNFRSSESRIHVSEMYRIGVLSVKSLKSAFINVQSFNHIKSSLEKTSSILRACEQLEYLSMNMSVMANKMGKEGPSLAVISSAFQKSSREVTERFKKFYISIEQIDKIVNQIKFDVFFSRVYVEMLSFYTLEMLESSKFESELPLFMRDFSKIIDTVQKYFSKTISIQGDALQVMKEFKLLTEMLKSVVMSLDLIRMGGRLEGSRSLKTEEVFAPYVEEMVKSIQSIEIPINAISINVDEMISYLVSIRGELNIIAVQLIEMDLVRFRDFRVIAMSVA